MATPADKGTRAGISAVPPPPAHGGSGRSDLEQAVATLQARIDEEFRITERLDSKARQVFALAAGFFVVVQTVAFGSFAAIEVQPYERVILGFVALVAGMVLIGVAHRLARGEELLEESDIKPEAVVKWAEDAGDDPEYVTARLVRELSVSARRRTENNEIRGRNYDAVAKAGRGALIASGAELIVAIIVRI